MRSLLLVAFAVAVASALPTAKPWMRLGATPAERAAALLAEMTLDEKLAMVYGVGGPYVGNTVANARLGIPAINMEDGPQGVADGVTKTTAWPSAMTIVASFDTDNMLQFASAMAKEQRQKGTNVLLGPMNNIARVPVGGRNFESFGEDPVLAAHMVKASIIGIQSEGIMGCSKHFVANNQEHDRTLVSSNVDERTMWELYYPAFQAAVEAGVGSIMCSYNLINGTYACENEVTLGDLKGKMGFKGFVMSDWGATHSTVKAANAGLDMQMPDASFFGKPFAAAVAAGQISLARVDDMITRILTPMFQVGLFDRPPTGNLSVDVLTKEHNLLARRLAAESTVLAKNEGNILPLDASKLKNIAVIGNDAQRAPIATGGGSGGVVLPYLVTPLFGIDQYVNGGRPRPTNCTFYQDTDFYQDGNPMVHADTKEDCCAACTNSPSCLYFAYVPSDKSCWLKPSNAGKKSAPGVIAGACAPFPQGNITVTYADSTDINQAVQAAKNAEVAIVFVSTTSSEGDDRKSLDLPDGDLITAVAAANPNTIVFVHTPSAVLMPWIDQVKAVLIGFMPGQEDGNAAADVLFGDVNPAARVPVSFPKFANDTWLTSVNQYPGVNEQSDYSEGLLIGYRWYTAMNREPLFSFGHGLSYTTFEYHHLVVVESNTVSVEVTNSGDRAGSEVVQLYLGYPAGAGEPPIQLRGFEKVHLQAGDTKTVVFNMNPRDFSIWSVQAHDYTVVHGVFKVFVGASVTDIRLTGSMIV